MKLVCDDCGNHSPEAASRCSLCGGSLHEERAKKAIERRHGSLPMLLLATLFVSPLLILGPAFLIRALFLQHISAAAFWTVYALAWGLGLVLGRRYEPRERYDLGVQAPGGGPLLDDPFTLRDNLHRGHAWIGVFLFAPNLVRGFWTALFRRLLHPDRAHRERDAR